MRGTARQMHVNASISVVRFIGGEVYHRLALRASRTQVVEALASTLYVSAVIGTLPSHRFRH